MHEMGLALEIIDIAKASIPDDMPGAQVKRVNLKVGRLSAVVPDSLHFCFSVASKDTPLANAQLVIDQVPVVGRCQQCRAEFTIDQPVFTCPECQHPGVEILSGRELDIESIEIEEEDQHVQ